MAGIVSGAIYAVTATGLVVTYSTTGVFNFAQGAMGMFLAFVFWQLWQGWNVPVVLALVLTLLVGAPLLGAVVERTMMRTLYGASVGVTLVVTIGLLLLLFGAANAIWSQTVTRTLPTFFESDQITVAGVVITYEQLITVGVAVLAAVGLRILYRRTRVGVAMRAVVDDPELTRTDGRLVEPDLELRMDDQHHVGGSGRHPARPPDQHEHPATHRAGRLRVLRRGGGPPAEPPAHRARRAVPRGRQLAGHRLRPGRRGVLHHPGPAHGTAAGGPAGAAPGAA